VAGGRGARGKLAEAVERRGLAEAVAGLTVQRQGPDTIGAVIREAPGAGGEYRIIVGCGQHTEQACRRSRTPGRRVTRCGLLNTWPEQTVREVLMVLTVVRMAQLGAYDMAKARRVMGRSGL